MGGYAIAEQPVVTPCSYCKEYNNGVEDHANEFCPHCNCVHIQCLTLKRMPKREVA